MSTRGGLLSSSSVSIGDVMWKRALGSVPAPLVGALRDAGLDDASTLVHYPRWSEEQFEEFLLGSGGSSLRQTAGAKDQTTSTGYGYFFVRLYCTGLGFQANIVEECVLLSALQHIFAGMKRTRDQKLSSGLMSCQLSLAVIVSSSRNMCC